MRLDNKAPTTPRHDIVHDHVVRTVSACVCAGTLRVCWRGNETGFTFVVVLVDAADLVVGPGV